MTDRVDEDLGAELRRAREQAGLTLRHIADATKLSVSSLMALENNRIKQLPGGIYRRAIVRAYASHVGLDPEKTLRAFLEQHPEDVPTMGQLVPPAPMGGRGKLHALVSLLALIPVFAAVFYFTSSAGGSDAPQVASVMPAHDTEAYAGSAIVAPSAVPRDPAAVSMMGSVSSPTRLQIVADGHQVLAHQLQAGDVFKLDLSDDVVLVGDDAGAVHFSINGRAGLALGDSGTPLNARISRNDYQDWLIRP
jgi:transcriptional regulator with XRE-family HTH domain